MGALDFPGTARRNPTLSYRGRSSFFYSSSETTLVIDRRERLGRRGACPRRDRLADAHLRPVIAELLATIQAHDVHSMPVSAVARRFASRCKRERRAIVTTSE